MWTGVAKSPHLGLGLLLGLEGLASRREAGAPWLQPAATVRDSKMRFGEYRPALAPHFYFTRAREYQTVLGFATDCLPPRRKALAFAASGVKR
jgi:hypothetical protein